MFHYESGVLKTTLMTTETYLKQKTAYRRRILQPECAIQATYLHKGSRRKNIHRHRQLALPI